MVSGSHVGDFHPFGRILCHLLHGLSSKPRPNLLIFNIEKVCCMFSSG
jgi:hypothetical protein